MVLRGSSASTKQRLGTLKLAICAFSAARMASHGRKGIKRLLLGSETQHVLTHSHIPVLVLR